MELEDIHEKEVIISFDGELGIHYSTRICRICHEEEEEEKDYQSCSSMETPCACSGSLQFAHRDCVQRWCDEKGSTICEICLQRYEPDYTTTLQKLVADVGVTNRWNTEVSEQREDEPTEIELVVHSQTSYDSATLNVDDSLISRKDCDAFIGKTSDLRSCTWRSIPRINTLDGFCSKSKWDYYTDVCDHEGYNNGDSRSKVQGIINGAGKGLLNFNYTEL